MIIMLWVYMAGLLLELSMYGFLAAWRARRVVAGTSLFLTAFASGGMAFWHPNVLSILIFIVSLYRLFNVLRIVEGRMHEGYLQRVTRRTGLILLVLQTVLVLAWLAWNTWPTTGHSWWLALTGLQLTVAAVCFLSTLRRLRRTAWPAKTPHLPDEQLPTITVAIPARNETEDLQDCLRSLIASTYPKLEIVVLDDCSQDKHTPEIIRDFAHDGVRFVRGDTPLDTWLPKNQAYDRLVSQSSGQYLLFCGVDIRFAPNTLYDIVTTLQAKKKRMMSIMPRRAAAVTGQAALAQAMRYWWELVPPRRLFNRPSVLSSCWIIEHTALKEAGGFEAVSRAIVPEAHFARRLLASDGYSFMRASKKLGLESVKSRLEQHATAVRMRYPQLHRRPENVLVTALLELCLLVAPLVLAIAGFWLHIGLVAHLMAAVAAVLMITTYELMGLRLRLTSGWFGLIVLPLMVLHDVYILHYSMWQYEFSAVDWKGRNICIPTMHVVPHLPPF